MENRKEKQKNVNLIFIVIGLLAIFLSSFMGLFATYTLFGIPAGILIIIAAFPSIKPEVVKVEVEEVQQAESQTTLD